MAAGEPRANDGQGVHPGVNLHGDTWKPQPYCTALSFKHAESLQLNLGHPRNRCFRRWGAVVHDALSYPFHKPVARCPDRWRDVSGWTSIL